MKAFLIIAAILLIRFSTNAQNNHPAKIYLLNASGSGHSITLQTTDSGNPITIKPRRWAIIQLNIGDSLGLLISKKPYFIHFERGKNYYFIAKSDYTPATAVTEKTEQEFLLSVQFNTADKPDEYILDK